MILNCANDPFYNADPVELEDIEEEDHDYPSSDTSSIKTLVHRPRRVGVFDPIVMISTITMAATSLALFHALREFIKRRATPTGIIASSLTLPFLLVTVLIWTLPKVHSAVRRHYQIYSHLNLAFTCYLFVAWGAALHGGWTHMEKMEFSTQCWNPSKLDTCFGTGYTRVLFSHLWVAILSAIIMMLLAFLAVLVIRRGITSSNAMLEHFRGQQEWEWRSRQRDSVRITTDLEGKESVEEMRQRA